MTAKILYVNHKAQKCGVYEFGRMVGKTITASNRFKFVYCECDSWDEFKEIYDRLRPDAVIYNYHPSTMPWIAHRVDVNGCQQAQSGAIDVVQIGTIHEVFQASADFANNLVFDYHIAPDPTLLLRNPIVYKTGRLVPRTNLIASANEAVTVGSFGFATNGKGFERIVRQVQSEFDEAIVNLNISYARYGDENGVHARKVADEIRRAVVKSGIRLNITHHHLDEKALLSFLAVNDINVFLYAYQEQRGIASATDWALAVNRPVAITKSSMFRHLFTCFPSICIEDHSIREILKNGIIPVGHLREEWSPANLVWDYERIMSDIFAKEPARKKRLTDEKSAHVNLYLSLKRLREVSLSRLSVLVARCPSPLKRLFELPLSLLYGLTARYSSPWITRKSAFGFAGFTQDVYRSAVKDEVCFNRILNDQARLQYTSAVNFLWRLVPEIMQKKISEANVQQGFVFDTAVHLAESFGKECRLLSVGAFEDTAFLALQKMGFMIDAIDPNINYDLTTFKTRPSVLSASYDLVISTSVIEHVVDDEGFVRDIADLLKPGGIAILTCDFHNDYVKGFEIPDVDCRFYTKNDLLVRLMQAIPECELYGLAPEWDCNEYDFCYMQKYRYTFASFVFIKKSVVKA